MERSDCTVNEQMVFALRSLPPENTKEMQGEGVYLQMKGSPHRRRVEMRRVESQGRNEQQPVRKHPVSSKHFYFCLIGVWVGGDQLNRREKRQEKRGEGISGCGEERGGAGTR